WETFSAWTLSMFAAGTAYTAQTHLNSLGRDDRERYLKDRLSTASIAKAAFQRAGWASIIPMGIDTGMFAAQADPVFDFRSTGLPSNALFGNPTADLINAALIGPGTAARLAVDGDYRASKQAVGNLFRALPLQNAMGIRNIQNLIASDLPNRSNR